MTVSNEKNVILTATQVKRKIRRIAFEIYENNFRESQIALAGIRGQGYALARLIGKELRAIAPLNVKGIEVYVNKPALQTLPVDLDCDPKELRKKCVVLVDDVLNTGKTLACAIKPFLSVEVKKIEVAVMINRSHALFPIYPNYTGLELSTTLNETVEVALDKQPVVYLC